MSRAYAEKWLEIVRACPKVTFYSYTRSHAVSEIAEALAQLIAESNAYIWDSPPPDVRE